MLVLKQMVSIVVVCFVVGCASTGNTRLPYNVSEKVQRLVGEDLFVVLERQFYAGKTALLIDPQNASEITLAEYARNSGFAVSAVTGDPLEIRIYYLEDKNTYVATMTIGEFRRFTKEYRLTAEGIEQIGSLMVGG